MTSGKRLQKEGSGDNLSRCSAERVRQNKKINRETNIQLKEKNKTIATYVGWDVAVRGKAYAVATHLCDDVFSQHHDLLCAVLDATRVTGEDGARDSFPELGRDAVGQCRSETIPSK